MSFGIWPAIYASVLSFLVYNFFFIPPLYTFTIAEPYELLALVIFLVVAVITFGAGRPRARAGENFGRAACARCGGFMNSRAGCRVWRRSTPWRKARRAKSTPALAVRSSCMLAQRRRSRADRGLAAGGCARRRGDDGGALGLQPRRAGRRRHRHAADHSVVFRAAADRRQDARRHRRCQATRTRRRSIRRRARCSIRCRSRPPPRWSAPRSRAKW